jgi:hypothetical protein
MNQRTVSILGYTGSVAAAVLAAALSAGHAMAGPLDGPFEGGQAANGFATGAPIVSTASRAAVAAEAREATRHIDSRSGYQSDSAMRAPFTSTASRQQVRTEALAAMRESGTQVYEGGQTGTIVTRMVRPSANLAARSSATAQ